VQPSSPRRLLEHKFGKPKAFSSYSPLPSSIDKLVRNIHNPRKQERVLNAMDSTEDWKFLGHGNWGALFAAGDEGADVALKIPALRRGKETEAEIKEWASKSKVPEEIYRVAATLGNEAEAFAKLEDVERHPNLMRYYGHYSYPHPNLKSLEQHVFLVEFYGGAYQPLDKLLMPEHVAVGLGGRFAMFAGLFMAQLGLRSSTAAGGSQNQTPISGERGTHFVAILQQLLSVIVHLEKSSLMHQDIKPGNMLYNPETKQLKLIDPGILDSSTQSLHRTGLLFQEGSPMYMPMMDKESTSGANGLLDFEGHRRCPKDDVYAAALVGLETLFAFDDWSANFMAELLFENGDPAVINPTIYAQILATVRSTGWPNQAAKNEDYWFALGAWFARFQFRAEQTLNPGRDLLKFSKQVLPRIAASQAAAGIPKGLQLMGGDIYVSKILERQRGLENWIGDQEPLVQQILDNVLLPCLLVDKEKRLTAEEALGRLEKLTSS